MEDVLRQALLFDFYGELLTEHQRTVYEEVVLNDLSYSEAAQLYGVSRQGVHELVKRSELILGQYEEKLHLVDRFLKIRTNVQKIEELASEWENSDNTITEAVTFAGQIRDLSEQILEEL